MLQIIFTPTHTNYDKNSVLHYQKSCCKEKNAHNRFIQFRNGDKTVVQSFLYIHFLSFRLQGKGEGEYNGG